jgi:L-fuconolactonase
VQIDAHQHFWQLSRGDYDWLVPELEALYRDFLPGDLDPLRRQHGIDATVLVQAAASFEETRFLLALADATPWVAGVVGWVDFDGDPKETARQLDVLTDHPRGVGVRPMIQDIPDPDWMLAAPHQPVFEMLVERQLRFDALVHPRHLPQLLRLLERHPGLHCVIDHGAKPGIAAGRLEPWSRDIARIARQTEACCKLSGLPSEAAPGWTAADLRPVSEPLLEAFGPERLLWGSDWPVVEGAGGFGAWREASLELLDALGDAQRHAVLGGNARAFYGLEWPTRGTEDAP